MNKPEEKSKYLATLSDYGKGWCNPTILVSATSEIEARAVIKHLKPHSRVFKIKKVYY